MCVNLTNETEACGSHSPSAGDGVGGPAGHGPQVKRLEGKCGKRWTGHQSGTVWPLQVQASHGQRVLGPGHGCGHPSSSQRQLQWASNHQHGRGWPEHGQNDTRWGIVGWCTGITEGLACAQLRGEGTSRDIRIVHMGEGGAALSSRGPPPPSHSPTTLFSSSFLKEEMKEITRNTNTNQSGW